MDAIESSQGVSLGQLASMPPDLFRSVDRKERWPVPFEVRFEDPILVRGNSIFSVLAREGAPGFRICNDGGGNHRSAFHKRTDGIRALLVEVELHKTTGVEIQDHRRSSITMSAVARPRIFGGLEEPLGLPPFQLADPELTRSQTSRLPEADGILLSSATGRPCSVKTTFSPRSTRRTYSSSRPFRVSMRICVTEAPSSNRAYHGPCVGRPSRPPYRTTVGLGRRKFKCSGKDTVTVAPEPIFDAIDNDGPTSSLVETRSAAVDRRENRRNPDRGILDLALNR